MIVKFLSPAEQEFQEAIDFYNTQSEGLGFDFAAEVRRTIERILQYPNAWSPISTRTRRCRTNRFPWNHLSAAERHYSYRCCDAPK